MKAVRIHDYGDRSMLRHEDAPDPDLRPGDVLIRVAAVAVNPAGLPVSPRRLPGFGKILLTTGH